MSRTSVSCLVLALCIVVCQSKICVPNVYEASRLVSLNHPLFGGLQMEIKLYRDYDQKIGVRQVSVYNSTFHPRHKYDVHRKGNVYYHFDIASGNCYSWKTARPFSQLCLPADAVEKSSFYVGQLVQGVGVKSFKFRGIRRNYTEMVEAKVDWQVMYPVTNRVFDEKMNLIGSIEFLNGMGFIEDPTVFDLPIQCEQAMASDGAPFGYMDIEELFSF